MKSIYKNKSIGNDSLTKEFYGTFPDDFKEPYIMSIKQAFHKKIEARQKDKL